MSRVFYYIKYPLVVLGLGTTIAAGIYYNGPDEVKPVPDLLRTVTVIPAFIGLGIGAWFKRCDQERIKWLKGKHAVTRQLIVLVALMILGTFLMAILANLVYTDAKLFAVIDWGTTLGALVFSTLLVTLYMRILMVDTKDDWK